MYAQSKTQQTLLICLRARRHKPTCEGLSASDLHTGYITSRSCTEATGAQSHCWHVLWTPSSFSPVSGVRMKFLGLVADLEGVAGVLGGAVCTQVLLTSPGCFTSAIPQCGPDNETGRFRNLAEPAFCGGFHGPLYVPETGELLRWPHSKSQSPHCHGRCHIATVVDGGSTRETRSSECLIFF